MTTKYYDSTDKKDIQPTKILSKAKNDVFNKIKNDKGQINMQISNEAYIELVSKNLYGDTTAFIREFVANEARQVKESMKLGNKDAHILITIDGYTRKIIIEGINSMGISSEEFDKIYRHYGRTGNNEGTASGQFGIGKASYLLVADTLLIESWSQKTDEKFQLLWKKGVVFEEMPTDGMKLTKHGTRFTVVAKEDIELRDICKYCNKLGELLGVPLYMNLVADSGKFSTSFFSSLGLTPGMNMISKTDVKKHLLEVLEISEYEMKDSSYVYIDTEDYTLEGVASKHGHFSYNLNFPYDVRLVGVPISVFDLSVQLLGVFTLNIKNERKFKPVSSRDSFTMESQKKIRELVQKDILDYYIDKTKDIKDLDTYLASENMPFFNDMIDSHLLTEGIKNENLASIITLQFDMYTNKPTSHISSEIFHSNLYNMTSYLNKETNVVYTKSINPILIDRVLNMDKNAIILILKTWMKDKKFVEKLEKCGIRSLSKFLKSKKIKTERLKKTNIPAYNFDGKKTSIDLSKLPKNIIIVPNDIRITSVIKNINYTYTNLFDNVFFVKEGMVDKIPTNTTNLIQLETLVKKVFSTKFITSKGTLTGKAIHDNHYTSIRPIITKENETRSAITMDQVEKITFSYIKGNKNKINYLIIQDQKKQICGITVPPLYLLPLANRYTNYVNGGHSNIFNDGYSNILISNLLEDDKRNIRIIAKLEERGIAIPKGHHPNNGWSNTFNILSVIKNKYLRDVVMLKFYKYNKGWNRSDNVDLGMNPINLNGHKLFTMIDLKTKGMDRDQTRNTILNMKLNNDINNSTNKDIDGIPSVLKYMVFDDIVGEFTDDIKKDITQRREYIQTCLNYMYKHKILNTKVTCELKHIKYDLFEIKLTFDNIDGFVFNNAFILAHLLPYYNNKKRLLIIRTIKHIKPNSIEITVR